jgi:hypothetical protein
MVVTAFSINRFQWYHVTVLRMNARFGFCARVWLVALLAVLGLAAVCVLPPLRQWQEYHQFADQAAFLGILNGLNVISNAAFVIVGLLGLVFLARKSKRKATVVILRPDAVLAYERFAFAAHSIWTPPATCKGSLPALMPRSAGVRAGRLLREPDLAVRPTTSASPARSSATRIALEARRTEPSCTFQAAA